MSVDRGERMEPLDPHLSELFSRERGAHPSEPLARDEVLARVERAVRLAPVTGALDAPMATGAGSVGKLTVMAAIAVAAAGGFGLGRATAPTLPVVPGPSAFTTVVAPPSTPARAPESHERSSPSAVSLPAPEPSAARGARDEASKTASAPSSASELAREQELIDTARGALARGRPDDALDATERHARRYPKGALTEEREALAVQALALQGRPDAARARGQRFQRMYPQSIFAPAVDRAVTPR